MTKIVSLDPVPTPPPEADTGANRDPLSGEVGAHPVGVGLGAAAAGLAFGAAVGTVTGPVGTAIGAIVGAVAGGLAGKGMAEAIEPTAEDAYWRANYSSRAYAAPHDADSDWAPTQLHNDRRAASGFEDGQGEMARGRSSMEWTRARLVAFDAWRNAHHADERSA